LSPFWLRSYLPEMEVVEDVSQGTNIIKIKAQAAYLGWQKRTKLIYFRDDIIGEVVTTVPGGSEDLGDYEEVVLKHPIPINIHAGDYLEGIYFCRMDTDTLNIEMRNHLSSSCRINFTELLAETPTE